MSPSAISPVRSHGYGIATNTNSFQAQNGLVSPPSTEHDSLSDHTSSSGYHDEKFNRSQRSVADSRFKKPAIDELHDLICIGFGPASLAVAIALHDKYGPLRPRPSVQLPKLCFLERQPRFAWHAGMQLPGAKMQISFLKDLATPRDPRSRFTFINYLHCKGRLNQFINLGTFLPTRLEYEDYLRWCSSHFQDVVAYGQDVISVRPVGLDAITGKVTSFSVVSRDLSSNEVVTRRARHVVIAVGGKPHIPKEFVQSPRVIHSSQFSWLAPQILEKRDEFDRIAVVGGGQSAAEIYSDLQSRYPSADVTLIIKGSALRPSDDSPFVNEIFDPDRVDGIFSQPAHHRAAALALDRPTNYGVVRLELLDELYEKLYIQRIQRPDPADWKLRILTQRCVRSSRRVLVPAAAAAAAATGKAADRENVELEIVGTADGARAGDVERLRFDAVFVATGYVRNAHEEMLGETRSLLPTTEPSVPGSGAAFGVSRQYRVLYDEAKVDARAGVWLQGCNEKTHGLSDTLLSILAVRSGELVESIFGGDG